MPEVRVLFYRDYEGSTPMEEWLVGLPRKPGAKCVEWIEKLRRLGYELHRPYADYLGEGIYELRVRYRAENYRMLYFFHGSAAVVLTHGFTKERMVRRQEIHRALDLKRNFELDPESHTYYWEPTA